MNKDERQQSLTNARLACSWFAGYLTGDLDAVHRERINWLVAGFQLLDQKEQKQIKAGAKGKKFGKLGGRPRKEKK